MKVIGIVLVDKQLLINSLYLNIDKILNIFGCSQLILVDFGATLILLEKCLTLHDFIFVKN